MKIKNIMANILCATLIISNLTVTSASNVIISETSLEDENIKSEEYVFDADISEGNISDTDIMPLTNDKEEYETPNSIEEIKVTYTQVSNYSVSIPKTISLDKNKQGTYSIKVTGNIDTIQQVHIEPIDNVFNEEGINFYMKDTTGRKANVLATVNQNKIYWDAEETANGYEETNNTINAPRLTSGSWEGVFQIKISLESKDHEHNYVDGICTECGEIDPNHTHNYVDGTCTICGQAGHVHNFVNGKCDCGELDPNHEHTYTETILTDATCTTDGEKKLTCSCGDTKTETIPATGHSYGSDDHCTDCGTLNPNHEHNYVVTVTKVSSCTDDGEKKLTCSCGDTQTQTIPATGHDFRAVDDKCEHCGILNPNHVHIYTERVIKAATCTENGEKNFVCKCGDNYIEAVPALGHDYSSTYTTDKEATCTVEGSKSKHCTRCDAKTDITIIPVIEHNYVNDECTMCGIDKYAIAPAEAINNWNYSLDDINDIIILNYYKGYENSVIVYGNYVVNEKIYKTNIKSNTSSADKSTKYMFNAYAQSNCRNIVSIKFSKALDTSSVTNMSYMFYQCLSLTSLDLSSLDTSNVKNMNYMFYYCSVLTNLDLSSFNTSKVTNMENMFDSCYELTNLNLSHFDTSKVTNMSTMFQSCRCLTNLNLSHFDTSKVTNMNYMFNDCSSLTSLDVSGWNTNNVINMEYMFWGCQKLTSLNLSSWNAGNVTKTCSMFYNCSSLTSLDLSSFGTSNVTNMERMFASCSSLTSLNLSNFDTSNVTNMSSMFYGCSSLTSLDLSSFGTSKVTTMQYMFEDCSKLTTIYVTEGKWDTSLAKVSNMFTNCGTSSVTYK